ncbi:MAG: transglycosylase domain-containing protein, partial [Candidatus Oxydemutatoraceae bacterium WSBS_2016_MAG_OTU14]
MLKKIISALFSLLVVGIFAILGVYLYIAPDLPSVSSLKEIQLQTPLRVYTQEGSLMGEFGEKRRIPIEYPEIPQRLINAFLAIEDDRFFDHPGVDYEGLLRATMILLQTGEKKQGGSTITMQLARNYFLSKERTYERKIKEIFLALFIERQFNKEEILNLYLNKIFLGHRAYGVGAAAQVYYGKALAELGLAEMAMIAGLPKAPSSYNPLSYPEVA